jgi:transcriptional regulator with PAS, ATPase and Fis domain
MSEAILDYLTNMFILADSAGKILKMNESAKSLLGIAADALPGFIGEIDPALRFPFPEKNGPIIIKRGTIAKRIFVFPMTIGETEKGYLYLFETPEILKNMDFDVFLDYIDEAIVIADSAGTIEHSNKATRERTGLDGNVGTSLKDEVRIGNIVNESATLRVVKSRKTEKLDVRFKTGKTMTFTSIPFFDTAGNLTDIISTGRDITKLLQLQEDLQKTEALKSSYYRRLSTLESMVGANTIVHSSEKLMHVVSLAFKAAKVDSPVFIWGESGVGKELIARLIHDSGAKSKKPFVGINCSAIPSELLETEFFGYEDGAFTGAKKGGKRGIFEEAGNGTIFLDEITELPLPMQSKLLRVLQECEFMRVGGTENVPLKARIISSSNFNKDQLADTTRFRRDLFYRLSVLPIFIPPLRDRREDILPLVHFFLKNMNLKYNTNVKISQNLVLMLHRYDWPGNVREMKNVIERLIIMADKDEIDIDDYKSISQLEESDHAEHDQGISVANVIPLKTALQKVEQLLLKKAFKECKTIPKTAGALEISPSTIYRKIEKGLLHLE